MVSLNAGREAVRSYVEEQARLGLGNVIALIQANRDAITGLTEGLDEEEANFKPAPAEFSISEVLQHLHTGFDRSAERLRALSSGREFIWDGPPGTPGGLPPGKADSFAVARKQFLDGEDTVLAIITAANPNVGLDLTADHAAFGSFNWLEWAVYSHHVHTHDHVGQVDALRREIVRRRKRTISKIVDTGQRR